MGYRYEKTYFIHKKTGIVDKLTVSHNLLSKNEMFIHSLLQFCG